MNEVSRFLRFTLPGLSSVFVLYLMLMYSDPIKTRDLIATFGISGNSGSAFVLFLGSGVLGFFYAQVYFVLVDYCLFGGKSINHLSTVQELANGTPPSIEIRSTGGKKLSVMNKREAWEIVTMVFSDDRVPKGKGFELFLNRMDRMIHMLHSLGTTLVGLVIVTILWIKIDWWDWNYGLNNSLCGIYPKAVWILGTLVVLGSIIAYAYVILRETIERTTNSTFAMLVDRHILKPLEIIWRR